MRVTRRVFGDARGRVASSHEYGGGSWSAYADKADATAFMAWIASDYLASVSHIREDAHIQDRLRSGQ